MLVDFRAFDTLGEITVLGIVGLTVYALLRRFRPPRESIARPAQQRTALRQFGTDISQRHDPAELPPDYLAVPAVLVRLLLPLALAFALYLLLRGHNKPGGGFIAGLVVSITLVSQSMASGTRWVEARLNLGPQRWIGAGLMLALLTGLAALPFGYPFLTTHTLHLDLPLLGALHLPSAALFDLGVFCVVVGASLLLLTALAHQTLRAQRQAAVDVEEAG